MILFIGGPVDWEGDQLTGENSTGNEFEFDVFIVIYCNARQSCSSHHHMTRNQINDTFLFQNRVKVKVVGEVSEK